MPRIGEVSQAWRSHAAQYTRPAKTSANDSKDWRKRAGYPKERENEPVKERRVRDMKVREWGRHCLQCRAWDDYNTEKVDRVVKMRLLKDSKLARLMRKKVRGRQRTQTQMFL